MRQQLAGRTLAFAVLGVFAAIPGVDAGVNRGRSSARAEAPAAWAKAHASELVELYRWFHSNPELSFEEKETAARLAKELKGAGVEVTEGVAKTGVVGILKNGSGPTVMIRCDLDALPVT
jgi:hypothetical protein